MSNAQSNNSTILIRDPNFTYTTYLSRFFSKIANAVSIYNERIEARRQLSSMNFKMLNDIGITRDEAMKEANKPFWKA